MNYMMQQLLLDSGEIVNLILSIKSFYTMPEKAFKGSIPPSKHTVWPPDIEVVKVSAF